MLQINIRPLRAMASFLTHQKHISCVQTLSQQKVTHILGVIAAPKPSVAFLLERCIMTSPSPGKTCTSHKVNGLGSSPRIQITRYLPYADLGSSHIISSVKPVPTVPEGRFCQIGSGFNWHYRYRLHIIQKGQLQAKKLFFVMPF